MMKPGQVVRLYSKIAGKQKYHLCISLRGGFLFLNSPKPRHYAGDLEIPCAEMPFLTPTPSGVSIICCTTIVAISDAELARKGVEIVGAAPREVLVKIMDFVDGADFLSDENRERILDGLDGWV